MVAIAAARLKVVDLAKRRAILSSLSRAQLIGRIVHPTLGEQ